MKNKKEKYIASRCGFWGRLTYCSQYEVLGEGAECPTLIATLRKS